MSTKIHNRSMVISNPMLTKYERPNISWLQISHIMGSIPSQLDKQLSIITLAPVEFAHFGRMHMLMTKNGTPTFLQM